MRKQNRQCSVALCISLRFLLEGAKETDENSNTFAERMQLHVIRNLELMIQNIHIVYEDRITKPTHPFAVGITLNYIKLQVELVAQIISIVVFV